MKLSHAIMAVLTAALAMSVSIAIAEVPPFVSYQGRLTNADGPIPDGVYPVTFAVYDTSEAGVALWSETKPVEVSGGLFDVQLGPIEPPLFDAPERYLGISVDGGPEMMPRTRLATVPYSFRSESSVFAVLAFNVEDESIGTDQIANGSIQFQDIDRNEAGEGQVMKWNGSAWVPAEDEAGSGSVSHWSVIDAILFTNEPWGITRGGLDNAILGNAAGSIVNWGVACTAGVAYADIPHITISGGYANKAEASFSTVGGGNKNFARGDFSVIAGGGGPEPWDTNLAMGESSVIGGGCQNVASGNFSVVSGGEDNHATHYFTFVGGGGDNRALAMNATVGGGGINTAGDTASTVAGGFYNRALGPFSTIGGGRNNNASGQYSVIAGGGGPELPDTNAAPGDWSAVGGGIGNTADGTASTIAGGADNVTGEQYTAIGGGFNNTANREWTTISGGIGNLASNTAAVVGGGQSNAATFPYCTVGGGVGDTASGQTATISGGIGNLASGDYSLVGGGSYNRARGSFSVIAGGGGPLYEPDSNSALGYCSAILGGHSNIANGDSSCIGGGSRNTASGTNATIPGGHDNIASGECSFAAGHRAQALHDGSYVWADRIDSDFASIADNEFAIQASNGIRGSANNPYCAAAFDNSGSGDGLRAFANVSSGDNWGAVYAKNYGSSPAVSAIAGTGDAGWFSGDVTITGAMSASSKSFKIDHPLDPENKYLYHSCVESDDMKNVYDGVVTLDVSGTAWVDLPEWFEALNGDFRYQLTAIGAPGPNLYIASEVSGNQFRIEGGSSGMKVSWQVTGIRKDPYAEANRVANEVYKSTDERGKYLHPEAYGLGEEAGVNHRANSKHEGVSDR